MKKTTVDFEKLADKWHERFSTAESNQEKLFGRFVDWYDAFNARIKVETAVWRSKPYMPIIAQQVWALTAKFSSMRPGFEVKVRDAAEDDKTLEERAAAAKKKLEYDYDCPYMDEPMREKLAAVLIDTAVTGTGIAKVVWKTKEVVRRERLVDEESNVADLTKEKEYRRIIGYNDFEPVNIFNVFVSPTTDRLNKGWLIIRDFSPISELKATNEAKGGKFYQNLDKLSGKPDYGNFSTYNRARNRMTTDEEMKDETVETATIYECYEGDNIYVFGESKDPNNRGVWVLLRHTKNYYWHGKWPIVKFHVKKRPFSFWGQGLAELAYRLNMIYNDLIAHFLDSWNIANNPMWWAPENAGVEDYVVGPGEIIQYQGQTPPSPVTVQSPDPNALQVLLGLMNGAIEGVTASQYATGLPNSGSDNTKGTATGIVKLQDAAGDIVGYMRENLTSSILQIGKMWYSNNQQFLSQPTTVVLNANGTTDTKTITPKDFLGEADIFVDSASMLPKTDDEKRADALALSAQLLSLQQASTVQSQQTQMVPLLINFQEMAQKTGEAFGYSNIQGLLMSEEDIQQYHKDKAEEEQTMMDMSQGGYSVDPDQAAAEMAGELVSEGYIDPEELMPKDTNAAEQRSQSALY